MIGLITASVFTCNLALFMPLTNTEMEAIRGVIYGDIGLGIAFDAKLGKDVFEGPDDIKKIHDHKPIVTVQYLLKIVETGRPIDAMRAGIFALEYKHGLGKYCVADLLKVADFDKPSGEPMKTLRERYLERIRK